MDEDLTCRGGSRIFVWGGSRFFEIVLHIICERSSLQVQLGAGGRCKPPGDQRELKLENGISGVFKGVCKDISQGHFFNYPCIIFCHSR